MTAISRDWQNHQFTSRGGGGVFPTSCNSTCNWPFLPITLLAGVPGMYINYAAILRPAKMAMYNKSKNITKEYVSIVTWMRLRKPKPTHVRQNRTGFSRPNNVRDACREIIKLSLYGRLGKPLGGQN